MVPDTFATLRDALFADPSGFEFYQAVRLFELTASLMPEHREDPIRFRGSYELGFSPAAIRSLDPEADPPEMAVTLLNLSGPQGPLPLTLAEDIADRLRAGDAALAHFLDLFHHRLISLGYQIRRKHRLALAVGWPEQTPIAQYLLALSGVGLDELRERLPAVADRALIRYAGLFWSRPKSAVGLAALLEDYFDTPVRAEQFVGGWRYLSPSQQTRLGALNHQLGNGAICGVCVWDQHSGLRLKIGPLRRAQFETFLPAVTETLGAPHARRALAALTRFYLSRDFAVDVQLLLAGCDVSPAKLAVRQPDGSGRGALLGYTSWILAGSSRQTPDAQVHFRLPGEGS